VSAAAATVKVPSISSPRGAVSTNATSFTIEGSAPAGTLVRIYQDANTNGVVNAGEPMVGSQHLAAGATAFSISVPSQTDTRNRLLVTASNTAGTTSTAAKVPVVLLDATPPTMEGGVEAGRPVRTRRLMSPKIRRTRQIGIPLVPKNPLFVDGIFRWFRGRAPLAHRNSGILLRGHTGFFCDVACATTQNTEPRAGDAGLG